MWSALRRPGLTLLSGLKQDLRAFVHELAVDTVHADVRAVLVCDGAHSIDPYLLAERNIDRGAQADHGADRILIKRCMTAFQWDTVLDKHLAQKLADTDTGLVVATPYDQLFVHQELADWEQEDHLRYSLRHLPRLAARHAVPIVVTVDMQRWWRSHPTLAKMTYEAVQARWSLERPDGRFRLVEDGTGRVVDPGLRRQGTLLDFTEEPVMARAESPLVLPPAPRRRRKTLPPL